MNSKVRTKICGLRRKTKLITHNQNNWALVKKIVRISMGIIITPKLKTSENKQQKICKF